MDVYPYIRSDHLLSGRSGREEAKVSDILLFVLEAQDNTSTAAKL
jgi:hypothetical protein